MQARSRGEEAGPRPMRPISEQDAMASLQARYELAQAQNQQSPITADDEDLKALYTDLFGPSMAQQIIEQYVKGAEKTVQQSMEAGDTSGVMRPMIRSVMQLDR